MADMRQCGKCDKWYREKCVGLSVYDADAFECPDGWFYKYVANIASKIIAFI